MAEANDWQYICTGCGHLVTAGADFSQPCPSCGGHGWICHWLKKPGPKTVTFPENGKNCSDLTGKSVGGWSGEDNHKKEGWDRMSDAISDSQPILSQPDKPKNGIPANNGRKQRPVPGDLINQLSQRGLSSRQIAADLAARGFHISYKSIQRYIKRQKQGNFL